MLKYFCFMLFVFLLGVKTNGFSQKPPVKEKTDCSKAITQAELNACANQQFIAADVKLNVVYKQVLAKLNLKGKQMLVKAQLDWIRFRDDNALVFANQYEGGSMKSMVLLNNKTETTCNRINELQRLIKNK